MTKHPFEMLISFCTGNQFRISNSQTMFDFRQFPTICGNSTLHTGFEVNPKLTHIHTFRMAATGWFMSLSRTIRLHCRFC